jgi:hypothetical protein
MNGERYVGLALDFSASSRYALKWAIDNCLRENDHLIILVVNKDTQLLEGSQAALWEGTGTRKIPAHFFVFLEKSPFLSILPSHGSKSHAPFAAESYSLLPSMPTFARLFLSMLNYLEYGYGYAFDWGWDFALALTLAMVLGNDDQGLRWVCSVNSVGYRVGCTIRAELRTEA